jgi:lysozyme
MKISKNCLDIIEKWESLKLDAYIDPVGIPTIGYGTIRYPNGQKVKLGEKISQAEAEAFLKFEIDDIVDALKDSLTGINLNQNQIDAVVSLCYNIGVGAFQSSTVLRQLKAGDFPAASRAFDLWNKGTVHGVKVVLQGLVNRRNDERKLFDTVGSEGKPIETEASPQDTVDSLELFNDGHNTVVVAMAGAKVAEILVLNGSTKEDLAGALQQYKNAVSVSIAPSGKAIPAAPLPVTMEARGSDIAAVSGAPSLERQLMIRGMRDDDPGINGSDINEMQGRLQDLGVYSGDIDGIFGRATESAVKDFQSDTMGTAEADGKVGPKTWAALWGTAQTISAPAPSGTATPGKNHLLLTKTSVKEPSGCFRLKLEHIKNGQSTDSIMTVSGQPKHQFFRKGKDSISKSFEPLPEGKWSIGKIEWAGGKDVYNGKVWQSGIGPAKIRLEYLPAGGTDRQNIEIHIDWNKTTLPGTAGCIGVSSVSDYKKLVVWLRDTDPKDLYVDWGLGSVNVP